MALLSGDFGVGGNQLRAVRLRFCGDLGPSFLGFVARHIEKLNLEADFKKVDSSCLVVEVRGPDVLVGALEMSCCLGPVDTVVTHWSCSDL